MKAYRGTTKICDAVIHALQHCLFCIIFGSCYRKSGLYKHMKFRDIDEAILDGVKEKLLEGFRNEEEFGYMAGYEPWEKLIFDR